MSGYHQSLGLPPKPKPQDENKTEHERILLQSFINTHSRYIARQREIVEEKTQLVITQSVNPTIDSETIRRRLVEIYALQHQLKELEQFKKES